MSKIGSSSKRTGTDVAIRDATPDDYPSVQSVLMTNGLPLAGVPNSLHGFVVAEAGGHVIGVGGIEYCGDAGLLRSVAVDSSWRGHQVARRLVERLISEAETKGLHSLFLLTTTAEAYFPRFGFVVTNRDAVPNAVRETREFTGACPASATAMARPLGPAPVGD